jgi:hippurate hydrolase
MRSSADGTLARHLKGDAVTQPTPVPAGRVRRILQGVGPKLLCLGAVGLLGFQGAAAQNASGLSELETLYPSLDALYIDLHRNPELSLREERTAAKMAARLRDLGFEVTEHVGGNGVVGVLRNGQGPTVLVRTDMDALPIK